MTDSIVAEMGDQVGQPTRSRPLWQHGLALLLLLAGLATYTGTRSAFVTDESFVVIQLDRIEDTGRWTLPHPFLEVDPEGAAFPLHGATRYEDGYTLYGKHPLLVYLYLPVHRAFGLAGLVGLSVLGTVGAALAAGAVAQRIRAGSGVLALWLVGAGGPLLFDAFLIHAHTLAAGLAALSAYLALRAIDERRWALAVGAALAAYGTALLRTEGVLFAAAMGGAIAVAGLQRRRLSVVLWGMSGVAVGAGAYLTDRAWAGVVADSRSAPVSDFPGVATSFVGDRLTSLAITTVKPGYGSVGIPEVLTILGAVLLIVGAVAIRRRPTDDGALLFPALGALLLVVRATIGWGPVPGLIIASCVAGAGLALLRGPAWRAGATQLLAMGIAGYIGTVALTQYRSGGHTEWGGRYFALAVPLIGAIAAASLHQAFADLPRRRSRALQASLLVASVALAALAVRTVHETRARNGQRSDAVLAAAAMLPPSADGGAPVVVTEDDQIPRLARGRFEEVRFLKVPLPHVARYLQRLADQGVEDVLLVSMDPPRTLEQVPSTYEQVGSIRPQDLQWDPGGGLIRLHLVGS